MRRTYIRKYDGSDEGLLIKHSVALTSGGGKKYYEATTHRLWPENCHMDWVVKEHAPLLTCHPSTTR